jgi:isopenicillin N synthase-like dioxygenase
MVSPVVPIVDLHGGRAVEQIAEAASTIGFLIVSGHDISPTFLDKQWDQTRSFFDLAVEQKTTVAMPTRGYPYGYAPFAYEQLSASIGATNFPDLKETYTVGPVTLPMHEFLDPDEASAWSPNLWPDDNLLPEFRSTSEQYFVAMADLCGRLLSMMAEALDLPANYFAPMIDRHTSALRMINYPALIETQDEHQQRASPHTDYGTLTVLLADPAQPGLQVQGHNGSWVDVAFEPGSFVVNLGDAMARWTNDRWRSTMHRVVPGQGRRQSIAFFHNANWDASIECLASCLSAGESPRYEPIKAGPHLMQKFRSTIV